MIGGSGGWLEGAGGGYESSHKLRNKTYIPILLWMMLTLHVLIPTPFRLAGWNYPFVGIKAL